MIQSNAVLTVIITCAVQCFISAVNIFGVKFDKVLDFQKSSHYSTVQ